MKARKSPEEKLCPTRLELSQADHDRFKAAATRNYLSAAAAARIAVLDWTSKDERKRRS